MPLKLNILPKWGLKSSICRRSAIGLDRAGMVVVDNRRGAVGKTGERAATAVRILVPRGCAGRQGVVVDIDNRTCRYCQGELHQIGGTRGSGWTS